MSTLAIVGAGPNLGLAAASRFGAEGFDIGLVARNTQRLEELRGTLGHRGIRAAAAAADIRRPQAVAQALEDLIERLGPVDVLLYSPSVVVEWIKPVAESTAADVRPHLELSVLGAIGAVQTVLPGMRERGGGTLLFTTGGPPSPPARTARARRSRTPRRWPTHGCSTKHWRARASTSRTPR
jgi:NADP-dependent 3-hydroxy acid dehydrogenase YdfG